MVPQGLDGVKQFFSMFRAAFPDMQGTVEHIVAEGDKVIAFFTWRGTHRGDFMGIPATGKSVTMQTADAWRVANGKLAEHWDVVDMMGAMQQIGLTPAMGGGRGGS